MSLGDFFSMGGYAFYVWGSWGMTVAVIAWNIVVPVLRKKQLIETLQREQRRNQLT